MKKKVIAGLLVITFAILGSVVSYEEQQKVYSLLITTASIITGIFGLWIGILCPGLLQTLFSFHKTVTPSKGMEARELLKAFYGSLCVLVFTMVLLFLFPLVKEWHVILAPITIWKVNISLSMVIYVIRGVSFGILSLLLLSQLMCIFYTIHPADMLLSRIEKDVNQQEFQEGINQGRDN